MPGRRRGWNTTQRPHPIYAGRLSISQMEPEDLFLLGLLNARAGRFESALELWAEAARKGDDDPELLDNLARLSLRMQRLDEAADAARRLSQKPGWEVRGLLLLGDILALLDDPKGSVRRVPGRPRARSGCSGRAAADFSLSKAACSRPLAAWAADGGERGAQSPCVRAPSGAGVDARSGVALESCLAAGGESEGGDGSTRAGGLVPEPRTRSIPEPSPYVGEASCASCHREEARGHEQSRHARTFHHGKGLAGSADSRPAPGRSGRSQGHAQDSIARTTRSRSRPMPATRSID